MSVERSVLLGELPPPFDDAPRVAYADWLDDKDPPDPRGETRDSDVWPGC